jgi:hypothetical protein
MRNSWSFGPREWKTVERFVYWYNFFFYFFFFFYFIILSSSWCNRWRFQDWKKSTYLLFSKKYNLKQDLLTPAQSYVYTIVSLRTISTYITCPVCAQLHSYCCVPIGWAFLIAKVLKNMANNKKDIFGNNHVTDRSFFSQITSCILILHFFISFDLSIYQTNVTRKTPYYVSFRLLTFSKSQHLIRERCAYGLVFNSVGPLRTACLSCCSAFILWTNFGWNSPHFTFKPINIFTLHII